MLKFSRLARKKEKLRLHSLSKTLGRHLSSAVQDAVKSLKCGDRIHGYTVRRVQEIPELMLTAVALDHDKTGAQHCHIARDDANNTFSVMFRTTPMDSTGVPHILEHTVLCGSRKYPVRDPFFKMINRTMATFMNAMTASDWTLYPFSSQNQKDFENLMSVYLDAVFYPQLRELDFCQEGWRLEHEDPNNVSSPIVFKGVVYNEMKGVFSSSSNLFCEAAQNHLMPSHTYGVVSGGDPTKITDLTWKQLKDFHFSHYHPTNSKFMTYGNISLERHLERINRDYLQHFNKIDVDTRVPLEPRWTEPRSTHISCAPDPMAEPDKQTTVSISYLLSDISDVSETVTLSLLGQLLTDGANSPFYQSLLEANIGSEYSPTVGFNGYQKESVFSVGLQGIHADSVDKVKTIISDTIDKVIREGFDQKNIDAVLHQLELGTKHQTSNFGLHIAMSVASPWNHDADLIKSLEINRLIQEFKQNMADNPRFLQDKVKHYFKDNQHRLVLTMSPDETVEEKRKQEERSRLQGHISKLTQDDRQKIAETGRILLEKQMAVEDVSCLPTLYVDELDKSIIAEPVQQTSLCGVPVQTCAQPTNEITMLRLVSDVSHLPADLKPYLSLFTDIIVQMGTGSWDYKRLAQEVDLSTGGLNVDTHLHNHHTIDSAYEQSVCFSSYCLDRNVDRMLDLWTKIFTSPDLSDMDRMMTLIRMEAADMSSQISESGHAYAMTHAKSHLSPVGRLQEELGGMKQMSYLKCLAGGKPVAADGSEVEIRKAFEEIAKRLLNKAHMRVAVNCMPTQLEGNMRSVERFLNGLPGSANPTDFLTKETDFPVREVKTQFELPFSVNFVSKAVQGVHYTHPDFPVLRVLSKLMWAKYLHREIREKGGAYGSGVVCEGGIFSFFSYRDPNSLKTLEVFDAAIDWALSGDFSDTDVNEAKLALFQQIDKPVTPTKAGMSQFMLGISDEMRQHSRDQLFQVTKEDITQATERYLKPGQRASATSFLGPANETVQKSPEWNVITG